MLRPRMAPSSSVVFLVALLCTTIPCCMSDGSAEEIVSRALECFQDPRAYSRCQNSYRLSTRGTVDVPHSAVDDYCGGPCLPETNGILDCIDGILDSFRFYNGASVSDVRYALHRGCGHDHWRGDFKVEEGCARGDGYGYRGDYGGYYYCGAGGRLAVPVGVAMGVTALMVWLSK